MKNKARKSDLKYYITTFLLFAIPTLSFAYVGPGAGITFLGALWAVITAIVLAVGGFLVWPIRAFIRHRKIKKQEKNQNDISSKVDSK
ncbi:MAG: hypothetical protein GWP19_05945 [Planctomycetia bacterium]|nr:hypothetical protein [Planctomycetia bacterium]